MLKTILLGLDASPEAAATVELGVEWARRSGAMLVGLAVVDEPGIAKARPALLGGPPYADPLFFREHTADARRQAEQLLGRFALRCAEAGAACKVLEDAGPPWERVVTEAQRYDLVLLGRRARFEFAPRGPVDDTLVRVLKHCPRPVVVVPETRREGGAVVVAFDGSLQASRALAAFEGLGLHEGREVHVLSVDPDPVEADRHAERAVDFLGNHGVHATAHRLERGGHAGEAVLEQVEALNAGLVVMGAYGRPAVCEVFLGSVTRTVLRGCPVPVFLCH